MSIKTLLKTPTFVLLINSELYICCFRKSVTFSNDGSLKAVFSKFQQKGKTDGEEKESIEIYNAIGKVATNDLSAIKRHGNFYTDGMFIVWFHFWYILKTFFMSNVLYLVSNGKFET